MDSIKFEAESINKQGATMAYNDFARLDAVVEATVIFSCTGEVIE